MREEAESTCSGARLIIDALATAVPTALALRAYLDRQRRRRPVRPAGRRLPGTSPRAMLERPSTPNSEQLRPAVAAMSRASFVRAFSADFGGTSPWNSADPHPHGKRPAASRRQTQKSLLDIAAETGYQSEAAFSAISASASANRRAVSRRQADSAC